MRMSLEEWKKFFQIFASQTATQQAAIANVSIDTIYKWRKRCEIPSKPTPPQFLISIQKSRIKDWDPVPEDWNNKEWLAKAYTKYGMRAIAKMVNKKPKWICDRLRQLGIKTNPNRTTNGSLNKDPEWAYYHYAYRSEYLTWCKKNNIEPCEYGGQGLSMTKCAALAGVSYRTCVSSFLKIGIKIRKIGEVNYGLLDVDQISSTVKRTWRNNYFEKYRQGHLMISVGKYIFKNGKLVGIKTDLDYRTAQDPQVNP